MKFTAAARQVTCLGQVLLWCFYKGSLWILSCQGSPCVAVAPVSGDLLFLYTKWKASHDQLVCFCLAQGMERYDAAEAFVESHVAAADQVAEGTTQFKLATMGMRKARWVDGGL
jgi:hypothetical protein